MPKGAKPKTAIEPARKANIYGEVMNLFTAEGNKVDSPDYTV
jgi:hypothetical protein